MNKGINRFNGFLAKGIVVMALGGYVSFGHAQTIINDLTAPTSGAFGSFYDAQLFVPSASVGGITGVTLGLNFNSVAVTAGLPLNVYLYNATGAGPTTSIGLLGTVIPTVAGNNNYTVALGSLIPITAGQTYAIVVDARDPVSGGTVAWEYTTSGSAAAANTANLGVGTFGAGNISYFGSPGSWVQYSGNVFQLEVVPEPSTTAFIGFGGLALIFVQKLRRNKKA